MKSHTVLLVEDDIHAGELIRDILESEGLKVTLCWDAETACTIFHTDAFDLCILDCMLPGRDGFGLARIIRSWEENIPILFLTAKSLNSDILKGFEIGADDYITKPFDPKELVYRIKAILRRVNGSHKRDEQVFTLGKYGFDFKNQALEFDGNLRRITRKESMILRLLCQNLNQLVSKEKLLLKIWGESDYFTGRSLDVFIAKLRKYLAHDPAVEIENVHGVGYILKVAS